MKKKISILIGGLLVALLVVGVISVTSGYAQGLTDAPLHGRGLGEAGLEAATKPST